MAQQSIVEHVMALAIETLDVAGVVMMSEDMCNLPELVLLTLC